MGFLNGYGHPITVSGDDAIASTIVKALPHVGFGYLRLQTAGYNGAYYSLHDKTQPGCYVKLTAGKGYMLFGSNHLLFYYSDIPAFKDLDETASANVTAAGKDPANYCFAENTTAKQVGIYQQLGSGKLTPDEDCYLFIKQTESEKWEVFEWDDAIGYPATLEDGQSLYNFMQTAFGYSEDPFMFGSAQNWRKFMTAPSWERYEIDPSVRRITRNSKILHDLKYSNFNICFIGDSITYAASNAGLQRAFRKQIPYKLKVFGQSACISGTCMTNGYGMNWTSGETGLNGLLAESDILTTVPEDKLRIPQIFVIALGTNDFGNDAPLGDVEADDRTATFAGCYLSLIEHLNSLYPDAGIICMCPFNRQTYDTVNAEGHKLIDYVRVIHEVVSIMPNTWVLDLFSHPIINYANYPAGFVDGVHINKYSHAVVANELYKIILQIITTMGFDYAPNNCKP